MEMNEWISASRKKAGFTQDRLADAIGVTRANVSAWENGRHDPSWSQILRIIDLTGCPPPFQNRYGITDGNQSQQGRFVPCIGFAQGRRDGYIDIVGRSFSDCETLVSSPSRDSGAYAIRMRGDSLWPRIRSGEYMVAEVKNMAQPGDDVLVKLKDGRTLVKEFRWIRDGEASLGSINDDVAPVVILLKDIESIHRIAGVLRRGSAILKAGRRCDAS